MKQLTNDVTIETYGILGKGRPHDPKHYYFLQSEGADAKIKTTAENTSGSSVSVEREGDLVYFKLTGTDKYLKFTTTNNNQVKWLEGKDNNAKWKEIPPIQPNAGKNWKSYVLVLPEDKKLYLRHTAYVMHAHERVENPTFYGDATWRIEGGMLVPPTDVPNSNAYGKKKMQTYATFNNPTSNFFAGIAPGGMLKIIDTSKTNSGEILDLEVRYKSNSKTTVLIDGTTGKYITSDANGNISLSTDEEEGSLWGIATPMESGLNDSWFSLKSKHPSLTNHYLRHTNYILYAHEPGTISAQYFLGDASWKLIDRE